MIDDIMMQIQLGKKSNIVLDDWDGFGEVFAFPDSATHRQVEDVERSLSKRSCRKSRQASSAPRQIMVLEGAS
jgi:hypothetical protein